MMKTIKVFLETIRKSLKSGKRTKTKIVANDRRFGQLYFTSNRNHASLLLAQNQVLEYCTSHNGVFMMGFARREKCKLIMNEYLNDRISIDARALFKAIEVINNIAETYK